MRENEKSDFAKMLTAVAELYGKKVSSALLSIYWAALERFNFNDIRRTITQHVNNPDVGQFMPKPADIVRYLEGDSETHALQAWSKVESTIRRVGTYASVAFDDPIIHAVILEMGGWPNLCATLAAEMPFRANEFMKRYQSNFRMPPKTHPRYLVGTFEQVNHTNGYYHHEKTIPVLVGDEYQALMVLKKGNNSSSIPIHSNNLSAIKFIKQTFQSEKLLTNEDEDP